jgi:hypothetical protein
VLNVFPTNHTQINDKEARNMTRNNVHTEETVVAEALPNSTRLAGMLAVPQNNTNKFIKKEAIQTSKNRSLPGRAAAEAEAEAPPSRSNRSDF